MVYNIYEGNMDRLLKKLTRIKNKCIRYGCEFNFRILGDVYQDVETSEGKKTLRFVQVEAEGIAKMNGWQFVASVDYTDRGNIINKVSDEIEIPERYYTTKPICEHCGTNRFRKYSYIVMSDEGEFKQVGKNCLADFTGGLSASAVAEYLSFFDTLVSGESPDTRERLIEYFDTREVLAYIAETISHFGYVKSDEPSSTRERSTLYFGAEHGWFKNEQLSHIRAEMREIGFDWEKGKEMAEAALEWLSRQMPENNFMHNLKVACESPYVQAKHFGILASLFPCYNRNLEYQKRKEAELEKGKLSEYIGSVGDRVDLKVKSCVCLTSWQTMYGITFLYKFITENDDVVIWKTSKVFDEESVTKVKGTVKAHGEFREVKQTELTRCKIA